MTVLPHTQWTKQTYAHGKLVITLKLPLMQDTFSDQKVHLNELHYKSFIWENQLVKQVTSRLHNTSTS